jgi:hypothetical protein
MSRLCQKLALLAIVGIAVAFSVDMAEAQPPGPQTTPTTATDTPAPTVNATAIPAPTNQAAAIENQVAAIEDRVRQLEDPTKGLAGKALDFLGSIAWPLVLLVLVFYFRIPLHQFINGLATRADKARIKIGDFEIWSETELDNMIVEREILKIGISIATIDKEYSEVELRLLEQRAASMTEKLGKIAPDSKIRILNEAINMAAVDNVIKDEEYIAIRNLAAQIEMPEYQLEDIIIRRCLPGTISPPNLLRAKFEQQRAAAGLTI